MSYDAFSFPTNASGMKVQYSRARVNWLKADSCSSRLLQTDRTVSRMHRKQIPTAVDLSVDVLFAETSFDGHRHVCFNVSVAGMQVHIGSKIGGQFQGDASVSVCRFQFEVMAEPDSARASMRPSPVPSSRTSNRPAAVIWPSPGASPQHSVYRVNILMAIAGLQIHFAFEICQADGTVPGMQIDTFLPAAYGSQHLPGAVHIEVDDVNVVRKMDFQCD